MISRRCMRYPKNLAGLALKQIHNKVYSLERTRFICLVTTTAQPEWNHMIRVPFAVTVRLKMTACFIGYFPHEERCFWVNMHLKMDLSVAMHFFVFLSLYLDALCQSSSYGKKGLKTLIQTGLKPVQSFTSFKPFFMRLLSVPLSCFPFSFPTSQNQVLMFLVATI